MNLLEVKRPPPQSFLDSLDLWGVGVLLGLWSHYHVGSQV